ncbi:MAG TPA: ATP-binding protein, partial [Spirochaetota bacterium]|nr:ATP-binding protein [Spirochaetota bacterium]
IGFLADAINSMVLEKKLSHKNLELIVEERTKMLLNALKEAQIVNKNRTKFLGNISHEIRTPLNSIYGLINLLKFKSFDKNDEILSNIERIIELINILKLNQKNENSHLDLLLNDMIKINDFLREEKNLKQYFFDKILENLDFTIEESPEKYQIINLINEITKKIDEEENETYNTYKRIIESTDYLLNIVNRLLNLTKIESGKIDVNKKNVIFKDFFENIKFDISSYIQSKNKSDKISIEYFVNENIPEEIYIDKELLKEVLLNLVTNAVKFTEKGKIFIYCYIEHKYLKFDIVDFGMGIKDEDKNKIFVEFGRTDDVSYIEGTGLGLVISKYIIELLGGKIGFESKYSIETTFWFTIPIHKI